MQTIAPFGFVTGCHPGDKFMVQATLASMRHFCPDLPVCLVADGGVDVRDLQRRYGCHVLRTEELANPLMRGLCHGSQHAKLAALWAGPFEQFVWLDADAIVWGDFTGSVRRDLDFQIFWSEISIPPDASAPPAWLGHFYFDLEQVLSFDPRFEWRGLPYFSTGTFACRRNAITFEAWMDVAGWEKRSARRVFRFGEQGQLEYMVHAGAQKGALRVDWTDLQYLVRHHGTGEIEKDTAGCGWRFPGKISRPRIAHFPGQKPLISNRRAYSRAFTIARLEHHRRTRSEAGAWLAVWKEEIAVLWKKVCALLRRAAGLPNKAG
jgi:hypothetical protein